MKEEKLCEICEQEEVYAICNWCLAEVCEHCAFIHPKGYVACIDCCGSEEELELMVSEWEGFQEEPEEEEEF